MSALPREFTDRGMGDSTQDLLTNGFGTEDPFDTDQLKKLVGGQTVIYIISLATGCGYYVLPVAEVVGGQFHATIRTAAVDGAPIYKVTIGREANGNINVVPGGW